MMSTDLQTQIADVEQRLSVAVQAYAVARDDETWTSIETLKKRKEQLAALADVATEKARVAAAEETARLEADADAKIAAVSAASFAETIAPLGARCTAIAIELHGIEKKLAKHVTKLRNAGQEAIDATIAAGRPRAIVERVTSNIHAEIDRAEVFVGAFQRANAAALEKVCERGAYRGDQLVGVEY